MMAKPETSSLRRNRQLTRQQKALTSLYRRGKSSFIAFSFGQLHALIQNCSNITNSNVQVQVLSQKKFNLDYFVNIGKVVKVVKRVYKLFSTKIVVRKYQGFREGYLESNYKLYNHENCSGKSESFRIWKLGQL